MRAMEILSRKNEDITKAYNLAYKLSKRFVNTHQKLAHYLDVDDYAQEAIIAWLEQKHIPYKLIDTYRKATPMSRRSWEQNKIMYSQVDLNNIDDNIESSSDVEYEADMLTKLESIQDIVNKLIDPRLQIIIIMKYVYDMSFTDIAKGLGVSKAYVSKLHKQCLEFIKTEVLQDGN